MQFVSITTMDSKGSIKTFTDFEEYNRFINKERDENAKEMLKFNPQFTPAQRKEIVDKLLTSGEYTKEEISYMTDAQVYWIEKINSLEITIQ